jgi:hypothetical protein
VLPIFNVWRRNVLSRTAHSIGTHLTKWYGTVGPRNDLAQRQSRFNTGRLPLEN